MFDLLKCRTHTGRRREQFALSCCFKLFLGLSWQRKAMTLCASVHVCVCVCDMRTLSVNNSPCPHLHLSFYLHRHTVLQSRHLRKKEKVQQHCVNLMNRCGCYDDRWCNFHLSLWFLCIFQWLKSESTHQLPTKHCWAHSALRPVEKHKHSQAPGHCRYCSMCFTDRSTYCAPGCIYSARTHIETHTCW